MKSITTLYWILAGLGLLLFVGLWIGSGSYPEIWQLEQRITEQAAENAKLTERNRQLEADVSSIAKSEDTIEDHARGELGMVKKGEAYYQVIMKEDSKIPSLEPAPNATNANSAPAPEPISAPGIRVE